MLTIVLPLVSCLFQGMMFFKNKIQHKYTNHVITSHPPHLLHLGIFLTHKLRAPDTNHQRPWRNIALQGPSCGRCFFSYVAAGQKDANPNRDHRWLSLFFLLPIAFLRYPIFLTHSHILLPPFSCCEDDILWVDVQLLRKAHSAKD